MGATVTVRLSVLVEETTAWNGTATNVDHSLERIVNRIVIGDQIPVVIEIKHWIIFARVHIEFKD